jgi:uroporphyrinogen-III decarboxylase
MLAIFRDYPAQILSWNPFDEGNFSIHQAAQIVDKVLLAGIDHIKTLRTGSPAEVKQQIESSLAEVPLGRLIIGPGCAAKTGTSYENLMAASTTAKGWKR